MRITNSGDMRITNTNTITEQVQKGKVAWRRKRGRPLELLRGTVQRDMKEIGLNTWSEI